MYIADNIIRNKLKNVYFIWGRGKTTVANKLRDKCGCYVFGTDEARDRNMAYAAPEYQPFMCRDEMRALFPIGPWKTALRSYHGTMM